MITCGGGLIEPRDSMDRAESNHSLDLETGQVFKNKDVRERNARNVLFSKARLPRGVPLVPTRWHEERGVTPKEKAQRGRAGQGRWSESR